MKYCTKNAWYTELSSGYVTLLAVLVVGMIGVTIATSGLLLGVSSSQSNLIVIQETEARALAHSCAEEGLERIRQDTEFTGSGNLILGNGSCSYLVTDLGGDNRRVTSEASVGTIIQRVDVSINQLLPTIEVTSWQEVQDF